MEKLKFHMEVRSCTVLIVEQKNDFNLFKMFDSKSTMLNSGVLH